MSVKPIVVYVAGPYRAPSEWDVAQNVRAAEEVALRVWRAGAACVCPHKNTAQMGGACDDVVWLQGDIEILSRCDALVCAPNWQRSAGAVGEVLAARAHGLPVFESVEACEAWIERQPHDRKPQPSPPLPSSTALYALHLAETYIVEAMCFLGTGGGVLDSVRRAIAELERQQQQQKGESP